MNGERRILCFGDSNTWGENPATQARYSETERWPRRLETLLGNGYRVIEEGLQGRAATNLGTGDPNIPRARPYLDHCLASHKPLDLIILALGTNDLKTEIGTTVEQIADAIEAIGRFIYSATCGRDGRLPHVIILAPPLIGRLSSEKQSRFVDGARKASELSLALLATADSLNCHFIALADLIDTNDGDGLHWDVASHQRLADQLIKFISENLLLDT